jgi:starvation-inducible outer membrane lipoprotein
VAIALILSGCATLPQQPTATGFSQRAVEFLLNYCR